jgi:peptidoglycan/xylan/chitin deacetylase (PgdA/CDA1 family)
MNKALILGYHAVSDRWPSEFSVTPPRLTEQLEFLLGRGLQPMTFGDVMRAPSGSGAFAITFDDGFRSVVRRALPLLSELGVPATVFAVTEFVGSKRPPAWPGLEEWLGTPFESELESLSWDELEQLAAAGWEIGSHSRSHPALTELDDASLLRELRGSREDVEQRLGRPCFSLAYPFGDVDDRVVRAAREAGYEAAATFGGRFHAWEPLRSPRVAVLRSDSLFRFRLKASPRTRWLRSSSTWTALAGARRAISGLLRRARGSSA